MIENEKTTGLAVPVGESDHVRGLSSAKVTLVEYGDFECPICAQAFPVVKLIEGRVGDRLRFVFRHLPLMEVHRHAQLAAEATEAAGAQDKFWQMHDRLFQNRVALSDAVLMRYADELGLDTRRFGMDVAHHVFAERVRDHKEGGIRSGVRATPGFFVNGVFHDTSSGFRTLLSAVAAASEA